MLYIRYEFNLLIHITCKHICFLIIIILTCYLHLKVEHIHYFPKMELSILFILSYLIIPGQSQNVKNIQKLNKNDILHIFDKLNNFNDNANDVYCNGSTICETTCGKHWRLYQNIIGNGDSFFRNYKWSIKSKL